MDVSKEIRGDGAYGFLPDWANRAFEASCYGLQTIYDKASMVSEGGRGIIPTWEQFLETRKKVREVMENTHRILECIRQAKGLD